MTRATALKITIQISYTDTTERVQDLLQYVRFMEATKKKRSRSDPNAPQQRKMHIPFSVPYDEPF